MADVEHLLPLELLAAEENDWERVRVLVVIRRLELVLAEDAVEVERRGGNAIDADLEVAESLGILQETGGGRFVDLGRADFLVFALTLARDAERCRLVEFILGRALGHQPLAPTLLLCGFDGGAVEASLAITNIDGALHGSRLFHDLLLAHRILDLVTFPDDCQPAVEGVDCLSADLRRKTGERLEGAVFRGVADRVLAGKTCQASIGNLIAAGFGPRRDGGGVQRLFLLQLDHFHAVGLHLLLLRGRRPRAGVALVPRSGGRDCHLGAGRETNYPVLVGHLLGHEAPEKDEAVDVLGCHAAVVPAELRLRSPSEVGHG